MQKLTQILPITLRKKNSAFKEIIFDSHQSNFIDLQNLPSRAKNIFIFSTISYDFRDQRPQKMARFLANHGYQVFYINHEFITTRNNKKPPFDVREISHNLYLLKLSSFYNYFIYTDSLTKYDKKIMTASLNNFINYFNLDLQNSIVIYEHPFWIQAHFDSISARKYFYDCFDDHHFFSLKAKNLTKNENQLFATCHTIASSMALQQKALRAGAKKVTLISNGTDFNFFHNALNFSLVEKNTFGYVGALNSWFDVTLLEKILNKFENCKVILAGKVENDHLFTLARKYGNLTLLGEISYKNIPSLVNSFEVCLIPFLINNLIKATDPIKFYEYLSLGKPIVTSALPELVAYKDLCFFSNSHEEFLLNLNLAKTKQLSDKLLESRCRLAKSRDWNSLFANLLPLLS